MSVTRVVVGLIRACHPQPAAAVTVVAAGLAVVSGRDARGVAVATLAVAASQLSVGWHNDWLDSTRDATSGRRDKPIATGAVNRRSVGVAAAISAVATVALALLSGLAAGAVATLGLIAALAYNWPLKFTSLSVLPYLVSFACLPAFIVLGLPGQPMPPWWLLAAASALGGGAHFANVLPDLDHDARTGVHGLPHRLGRRGSTLAAAVLLALATVLLVFGPPGSPALPLLVGLALAIGVLAGGAYRQGRHPASRAAFRAILVVALIDVALLFTAGAPALSGPPG